MTAVVPPVPAVLGHAITCPKPLLMTVQPLRAPDADGPIAEPVDPRDAHATALPWPVTMNHIQGSVMIVKLRSSQPVPTQRTPTVVPFIWPAVKSIL